MWRKLKILNILTTKEEKKNKWNLLSFVGCQFEGDECLSFFLRSGFCVEAQYRLCNELRCSIIYLVDWKGVCERQVSGRKKKERINQGQCVNEFEQVQYQLCLA